MSSTEGYVYALTEQSLIQVILHVLTIVITLGLVLVTVYLVILVIKLMTRGIKALDLWNEKQENK